MLMFRDKLVLVKNKAKQRKKKKIKIKEKNKFVRINIFRENWRPDEV